MSHLFPSEAVRPPSQISKRSQQKVSTAQAQACKPATNSAATSSQGRTHTPPPPPVSDHRRGVVKYPTTPRHLEQALTQFCCAQDYARTIARLRRRWPSLDAEDIVQDAMLSLLKSPHAVDPDRPTLPLIWVICHRRAIDQYRRSSHYSGHEPIDAEGVTASHEGRVHAELDTQNLLRTLPSAQRVAVASTQLLELTAKEIESRFGQSANAVRVNVHRGLARLREHVTASEHPMPQTEGVSYA